MTHCMRRCSTASPDPLTLVDCVASARKFWQQVSTYTHLHSNAHAHTHAHTRTCTYNTHKLSPRSSGFNKDWDGALSAGLQHCLTQPSRPCKLRCSHLQVVKTDVHSHTHAHVHTHIQHTQAVSTCQGLKMN